MKASFQGFYESYLTTCRTNMKLQGHVMRVRYIPVTVTSYMLMKGQTLANVSFVA